MKWPGRRPEKLMHVNDACERGSGSPGEAGVGVVRAETVAGATPGPS